MVCAMKRKRQSNESICDPEVGTVFERVFEFRIDDEWQLPPADSLFSSCSWQCEKLQLLKCQLNAVKAQLSDKPAGEWGRHTNATSLAGAVRRRVARLRPELLTQAWCKFYELLARYQLVHSSDFGDDHNNDSDDDYDNDDDSAGEQRRSPRSLTTLHLCEAPGAFIAALNHYCVSEQRRGESVDWLASTLNPHHELNTVGEMIADDRLLLAPGASVRSRWLFGPDNRGDLRSRATCDQLVAARGRGTCQLVTGDGSVDCSGQPDQQELTVLALLYCETLCALATLAQPVTAAPPSCHLLSGSGDGSDGSSSGSGGTLVLKMFTFFESGTVCLLYLLATSFARVQVVKPVCSKAGNSEVYVVCRHRRAHTPSVSVAKRLWQHYGSTEFAHSAASLFARRDLPDQFVAQVVECANYFAQLQMAEINRNVWLYQLAATDSVAFHHQMALIERRRRLVADQFVRVCRLRRRVPPARFVSAPACSGHQIVTGAALGSWDTAAAATVAAGGGGGSGEWSWKLPTEPSPTNLLAAVSAWNRTLNCDAVDFTFVGSVAAAAAAGGVAAAGVAVDAAAAADDNADPLPDTDFRLPANRTPAYCPLSDCWALCRRSLFCSPALLTALHAALGHVTGHTPVRGPANGGGGGTDAWYTGDCRAPSGRVLCGTDTTTTVTPAPTPAAAAAAPPPPTTADATITTAALAVSECDRPGVAIETVLMGHTLPQPVSTDDIDRLIQVWFPESSGSAAAAVAGAAVAGGGGGAAAAAGCGSAAGGGGSAAAAVDDDEQCMKNDNGATNGSCGGGGGRCLLIVGFSLLHRLNVSLLFILHSLCDRVTLVSRQSHSPTTSTTPARTTSSLSAVVCTNKQQQQQQRRQVEQHSVLAWYPEHCWHVRLDGVSVSARAHRTLLDIRQLLARPLSTLDQGGRPDPALVTSGYSCPGGNITASSSGDGGVVCEVEGDCCAGGDGGNDVAGDDGCCGFGGVGVERCGAVGGNVLDNSNCDGDDYNCPRDRGGRGGNCGGGRGGKCGGEEECGNCGGGSGNCVEVHSGLDGYNDGCWRLLSLLPVHCMLSNSEAVETLRQYNNGALLRLIISLLSSPS